MSRPCNSVLAYLGCTRGNATQGIPSGQPVCIAPEADARACKWSPIHVMTMRDDGLKPLFGGTDYCGPRPERVDECCRQRRREAQARREQVRQRRDQMFQAASAEESPPIMLIEPRPIDEIRSMARLSAGVRWG